MLKNKGSLPHDAYGKGRRAYSITDTLQIPKNDCIILNPQAD